MEIRGSVVVITGGMSGLGAAAARLLERSGGQAAIVDRNPDAPFPADVCEADALEAVFASIEAQYGAIHGLVHCAGIVDGARVVSKDGAPQPLDRFARVIQVNLIGAFNAVRLAAAAMARNAANALGERGVIVQTASVAAFEGQAGQAAYSASKAGIVGMTLPLARDLARLGIRVMTIAPGIFDTPMMAGMTEEVRASLAAQVPFPPRLGRPEEFAALVKTVFENPMLNGETIRLDGALRMGPR